MKKVALIACLMVVILPDARVWSEALEADTDPDSSGGLFAWVKVGSAPTGYVDYDGKVSDSDAIMYGDQTVFYGLADADVARVGGGAVKAVAIKWYHDSYWSGEDMHLPDNGSSLGMASATYKPFVVTSDDVAEGETVNCTINVVYDGLIVLQEKKEGEYSSGQIDFGIELLDAPDEDSFVTTSTGEEFCFEG